MWQGLRKGPLLHPCITSVWPHMGDQVMPWPKLVCYIMFMYTFFPTSSSNLKLRKCFLHFEHLFENYGHWMLYQDVIVWDLFSQHQWWRYSTLWTCISWEQKGLLHWFRFHSDPLSMPYICSALWFVSLFLHVFSIGFLQEYILS